MTLVVKMSQQTSALRRGYSNGLAFSRIHLVGAKPMAWLGLDRSIAPTQSGHAVGDLVGGQVFDVDGNGPLVAVGVGDAGEVVAVELVGGFSDARL